VLNSAGTDPAKALKNKGFLGSRQIHDTTPTEQSVLAALAFYHNSKTGRCDPSRTTIGEMTHFGKSSVRRALDTLKEKNYISWISGGKGKRNESDSNKYTLYPKCGS